MEGSGSRPAAPKPEPLRLAVKPAIPEKPQASLEPVGAAGIALGTRPAGAGESPRLDLPRASKLGQVVTPQVEEDKKGGNGKSFFGRMFGERKSEPSEKIEPKTEIRAEEPPEILRIASCGQPRLTAAGSVEIPITLELSANGQGKRLAVNLKVAVNLEPLPTQGS